MFSSNTFMCVVRVTERGFYESPQFESFTACWECATGKNTTPTYSLTSPSLSHSDLFFLSMPFVHLGTMMPFRRAEYQLSSPAAPSSLRHAFLMDTLVQRTNDFYFWQGRASSSYIGMRRERVHTHTLTVTQNHKRKSKMSQLSAQRPDTFKNLWRQPY